MSKIRRTKSIVAEHGSEIASAYLDGASLSKVASEWGISINAVVACLERQGVARRPGGPKSRADGMSVKRHNAGVLAEHGDAIAAAYATESIDDIAIRYEIDRGAVTRFLRKRGVPIRPRGPIETLYGELNPAYRSGSYVRDGYRHVLLAPDHPFICMAQAKRYVPEHRLVLAQVLGRPLSPNETVHHIDGDRLNNDPANLQLRHGRHGKHVHLRCHDCGSQNVGAAAI